MHLPPKLLNLPPCDNETVIVDDDPKAAEHMDSAEKPNDGRPEASAHGLPQFFFTARPIAALMFRCARFWLSRTAGQK